ncbi:MAG TPA: class I SAM-dependent methyltransferase [Dehalococcoidia bacterium]|nr:class I SAM-dependent methyltransferase [Dehalococcoidia bacterium]
MTAARVGRAYNRWVKKSVSGRLYGLLAGPPGLMLVNTPAFNLHEELQLQPETRLLDIGCGSGALLELLASRVAFQRRPVGIDLSTTMLHLSDPRRASLVEGSGVQLPFADESFDVVTCAHVAKHLDDTSLLLLLAEVRRVLSFGGIAVVWDFAPTRSRLLNQWNEFVVTLGVRDCILRGYTTLSAFALEAGFEWVGNAHLRPFIYPPIPRASVIMGKAPVGWREAP